MEGVVDSKSPVFACALQPSSSMPQGSNRVSIDHPRSHENSGPRPPPATFMATFPSRGCSAARESIRKWIYCSLFQTRAAAPARSRERRLTIEEWGRRGIHPESGGRCPKDLQVSRGCTEIRDRISGARFWRSGHRGVPPGIHHPKISGDAGRFKPSRALAFGAEPSLVPSQKGYWSTKGSEIQKLEQNFACRPPKRHKLPRRFIKRHKVSEAITKCGLIPNLKTTLYGTEWKDLEWETF